MNILQPQRVINDHSFCCMVSLTVQTMLKEEVDILRKLNNDRQSEVSMLETRLSFVESQLKWLFSSSHSSILPPLPSPFPAFVQSRFGAFNDLIRGHCQKSLLFCEVWPSALSPSGGIFGFLSPSLPCANLGPISKEWYKWLPVLGFLPDPPTWVCINDGQ